MRFSRHARIRMGQRGIPGRMIELARKHGRIEGDQWVLDIREAKAALDQVMVERAALRLSRLDPGKTCLEFFGMLIHLFIQQVLLQSDRHLIGESLEKGGVFMEVSLLQRRDSQDADGLRSAPQR